MSATDVIVYENNLANGQPNTTSGIVQQFAPGSYNMRDYNLNDKISAMIIPWNMSVDAYKDDWTGTEHTFGGGLVTKFDLDNAHLNDAITTMRVNTVMDYATWSQTCCRGQTTTYTDPTKCGNLWKGSPGVCGNLGCTGTTLKYDGACQEWCKAYPASCDIVKLQFCSQNPSDPYCGCINDTPAAIAERAKYPSIVANRSCWPGSDCQKTDLAQTFITTDLANKPCPSDLNTQILNLNNTGTIVGSNISQDLTTNKGNNIQNQPTNKSKLDILKSHWVLVFILFFIILIAVVSMFLFDDSNDSSSADSDWF